MQQVGGDGSTLCCFTQVRTCQGAHNVEGVLLREAGLAVAAPCPSSDVLGGDEFEAQGDPIQGGKRSVSLARGHRHLHLKPCLDVVQR